MGFLLSGAPTGEPLEGGPQRRFLQRGPPEGLPAKGAPRGGTRRGAPRGETLERGCQREPSEGGPQGGAPRCVCVFIRSPIEGSLVCMHTVEKELMRQFFLLHVLLLHLQFVLRST